MGRPKGAKNKSLNDKVTDVISEVTKIKGLDPKEVAEAVSELEDLLGAPELPTVDVPKVEAGKLPRAASVSGSVVKVLLGYHPVTGAEVYQ